MSIQAKKTLLAITIIMAAMIVYWIAGNLILYPFMIPDPCYYDTREIPFLIELLFDFPSSEGYHPVPSRMGYLVFGVIGLFFGLQLNKKLFASK